MHEACDLLLRGGVSDVHVAAFLFGLKARGETEEEVEIFLAALERAGVRVTVDGPLLDIVGTGGDQLGAINISTPASVLASAVGNITVIKHGNRGLTTRTGAADVVEALGISTELTPDELAEVAKTAGIAFCFAPKFQPALKHMAVARRALGVPTMVNAVAPLLNPARPDYQLVGVADSSRMALISRLVQRRTKAAIVARGQDGLDKFSVCAATDFIVVTPETMTSHALRPGDVGMSLAQRGDIAGGSAEENAAVIREVLSGLRGGPMADVVVLNAAVALVVAEEAFNDLPRSVADRVQRCRDGIHDGRAIAALNKWADASAAMVRETA